MSIIELHDVGFSYPTGDFTLQIDRLAIERGETVAVIGPSGSGKTTLLNLIAGISTPSIGRIVTNGFEINDLDDPKRRDFRIRNIGLVFQEFELLEHLDVRDNILLPYRINASLRLDETIKDRARTLARHVGIEDKLRRFANLLSQGEKQRVAVCRALLANPELLLADEPTGNLDPANRDRVFDILFGYVRERGATLVTVTHDHELLERFSRIVDLRDVSGMVS